MTAIILDGKQLAMKICQELQEKISKQNVRPHLAVVLVGNNDASKIYVRNKQKAADEIGFSSRLYTFSEDVLQNELEELIARLNHDSQVHGIMIQLPLPSHINTDSLLEKIDPLKDVDGFHPCNIGLLQNNSPKALIAATPKGIMRLLESTELPLRGKQALVIGRSQIVGRPIAMLLLNKDCTVTIAHSHTNNLPELVKSADIIVAACGCPNLIKGEWLKDDAIVIDVGINRVNGTLCGDVEFSSAVQHAGYITPVPGGVGPMTIAMLLENTIEAYLKQKYPY